MKFTFWLKALFVVLTFDRFWVPGYDDSNWWVIRKKTGTMISPFDLRKVWKITSWSLDDFALRGRIWRGWK